MSFRTLLMAVVLGWGAGTAHGAVEPYHFDDPSQERRFKTLSHELRCLVCQNQSLAESNADLARDLRDQVYSMIRSGASNQEIIDYMTARYGDFVLYRPPLKTSTYLLWFGPFVLAVIALGVLVVLVRRSRVERTEPLSEEERDRLSRLLGDTDQD